ncbi:MAG: cupin domain-containing protein [Planctomycetota bacterium]|nr:cupin domain-containing protein [Planctomycetota bacterium]
MHDCLRIGLQLPVNFDLLVNQRSLLDVGRSVKPPPPRLPAESSAPEGPQVAPPVINLARKLDQFSEQWTPKVIAQLGDYQLKLAKLEGEFVWHQHPDTEEGFLVLSGQLQIEFRDQTRTLQAGELCIVPRGVEHKPIAPAEAHVLLLVREGTINTGDAPANQLTNDSDQWI